MAHSPRAKAEATYNDLPSEILRMVFQHLNYDFVATCGSDLSMLHLMKLSPLSHTIGMEVFFDEPSENWSAQEWSVKERIMKRTETEDEVRQLYAENGRRCVLHGEGPSRRELWRRLYGRGEIPGKLKA